MPNRSEVRRAASVAVVLPGFARQLAPARQRRLRIASVLERGTRRADVNQCHDGHILGVVARDGVELLQCISRHLQGFFSILVG